MITQAEFSELLQKFHDGTLSDEGRAALLESIANDQYPHILKEEIFMRLHDVPKDAGWTAETENDVLQQILAAASIRKSTVINMKWLRRISVAAVFLLMAGTAYFTWFTKPDHPKPAIAKLVKKDVLPGKEGAVLTLSDGRQIVLDSASNGNLAIQGNAQVVKNNGQISYNNGQRGIATVVAFNTLTTPRGRQYEITLPDGTAVWLNAASSITYPTAFTGVSREVTITGEAYFEVAKNASMPFHVKVNEMTVTVLGTHFNINSYSNESSIRTTLLEGSVLVSFGEHRNTLKPGQQALVSKANNSITLVTDADTDLATAWKNGFTSFKSADIKSIMRQVERWYDVNVLFEGNIPLRTFTGDVARNAPVSEVFKIFEESKIHYRVEDKTIIVTP